MAANVLVAVEPSPWKVATKLRVSQPVGLTKKFFLSTVISILRTGSGMPPRLVGIGGETTFTPVSEGRSCARFTSTTRPRSIGPTLAGITITKLAASPAWTASPM